MVDPCLKADTLMAIQRLAEVHQQSTEETAAPGSGIEGKQVGEVDKGKVKAMPPMSPRAVKAKAEKVKNDGGDANEASQTE